MFNRKACALFVSHNASRSGAPLILLGIIREFKKQSNQPFKILLMEGGDLVAEFQAEGQTFLWYKKPRRPSYTVTDKLASFFTRIYTFIRGFYILFQVRKSSIVLFNTISNGHIHKKLLFLKAKYISYIHELETAIKASTSASSLEVVKRYTHFFITGSYAVKNNLESNHFIPPSLIKVVFSSIPELRREKENYSGYSVSFRKKHCIPENAVIVGVAAVSEWRKGFDWLFPLALLYYSRFPMSNAYFLWKGYSPVPGRKYYELFDFQKCNLGNRVILSPHGNDNLECIACFDINLLLSREDPYPLVILEAASFGIPTICFKDSGGSEEFVGEDAGYCVPYGDLNKMAESIHDLEINELNRIKKGEAARKKLNSGHDVKTATATIIHSMELLSGNRLTIA